MDNSLLERKIDYERIRQRIQNNKVTAIIGPRQSGKTTIARDFQPIEHFDLENPRDQARLENPQIVLEKLRGLIVIDEIQRHPDLFPLIRYLVDNNADQKYLVLGSASRDLIQRSSETLAGRISYYTLPGFRIEDVGAENVRKLWVRGGYPLSFLAAGEDVSGQWRQDYMTTFLERDIPQLGIRIPAQTLRRFWQMIAFYHGGMLNFSEIGRSFGIADTTVRHYLDILQGTFMIRLLQPWHENFGKRIVKRPKLYIRDSGIYHTLMTIQTEAALEAHPKLGASWEGFALECVLRSTGLTDEEVFFWATHSGAELDLFWMHDGQRWGCEFKYGDAPVVTNSMITALETLKLDRIWVVYTGLQSYDIHEKIKVLSIRDIPAYWDYNN
jgi:predicted AAA+ superfamily ATPase